MKLNILLVVGVASVVSAIAPASFIKRGPPSGAARDIANAGLEKRMLIDDVYCDPEQTKIVTKNARDCHQIALLAASATETDPAKLTKYFKYDWLFQ